ncbi:mandelate racemase/muconate lactonizing enzyme family protein [Cupriavidus sp. CP313]
MNTVDHDTDLAFTLEKIEAFVFRAPADPPVQTSFGIMKSRPAVLLRVTDMQGAQGWGEVWCNFPSVGAEHRARMATAYLPQLVSGRRWENPQECFQELTKRLAVLALQSGEPGPLHQIVAGLDVAIWDLLARRVGLPLWRLLGEAQGDELKAIRVYASGLNPTAPEKLAEQKLNEGYKAFKLKVGFGADRDERNLSAVREVIGDAPFMVDANQAWTTKEAIAAGRRMARFDLEWLEEPIRADATSVDWAQLAREQPLPLAGGENVAGANQFALFVADPAIAVVQPDIGKWGGFSGCLGVGRTALRNGKLFCPHWLGAGIGLTASLHLKVAVGGDGYVEVDANPNPLREVLAQPAFHLMDGCVQLNDSPGLGVAPDLNACREFGVQLD